MEIAAIPPGCSIPLARELANLILAAYDEYRAPVGRTPSWPLEPPFELVTMFSARLPFHETEAFGFVARRSDTSDVYVAFRGTESVDDWLINIEVRQVAQHYGWGNVEAGFADVYGQCSAGILAAIKRVAPSRIFIAGHSLGGALASLCAADVKTEMGITPVVYTFASPRVGNPAFAQRFQVECPTTWRVANTEDMITTVPPPTSIIEGRHVDLLTLLIRFAALIPVLGNWVRRRIGWTRVWRSNDVYEHVGTPVVFTANNGTVMTNHGLMTYLAALGSKTA